VDFGHITSLDLGTITIVFQALGITGKALWKELEKMRLFHDCLVMKKEIKK